MKNHDHIQPVFHDIRGILLPCIQGDGIRLLEPHNRHNWGGQRGFFRIGDEFTD